VRVCVCTSDGRPAAVTAARTEYAPGARAAPAVRGTAWWGRATAEYPRIGRSDDNSKRGKNKRSLSRKDLREQPLPQRAVPRRRNPENQGFPYAVGTPSVVTLRRHLPGHRLGLGDERSDGVEPAAPERRVPEVDAEAADEDVRPVRAPGGEEVEVLRRERRALPPIPLVEREHEQLAEGVGIDVARGVDEVGDVAPPVGVPLRQRHALAVERRLRGRPVGAEVLG